MKKTTVNPPAALMINGERGRSIKFFTFGCKVNQYETQSIREQFAGAGFDEPGDGSPADFCLVNTCTVTHKADCDCLGIIRRVKRQYPRTTLIVTGCLAELDEQRIRKADPTCVIVKNKDKERIVDLICRCRNYSSRLPASEADGSGAGISYFKGHARAFLKIQDGCNNSCSYCKVPLVRGRSRSRLLKAVLAEAQRLVNNGIKELVLCGICLGAYGKDLPSGVDLVDVIEGLEKIEGLLRVRLSSIEAADVSDALIDKMAQSQVLCRHLHIPVQSGDDEVLKRMNRRYTSAGYEALIGKIRSRIPLIAITTDVLVGFPGESDDCFNNTLGFIRKVAPLKTHVFPYSPRKGTDAADNFPQQLCPGITKKRIAAINSAAADSAAEYKSRFLGRDMEVLIEGRVKDDPRCWQGHTDNYIKVMVKSGLDLANKLITLRLNKLVKDHILAE